MIAKIVNSEILVMVVMIMTSKTIFVNQKVHARMLEVTMSSFISRQALCDELQEYKVHTVPISSDESEVKGYNDGIDLAFSVISEFSSAEPSSKIGKWIDDGTELGCCCSECGITLDDYFYGALYEIRLGKMPNFCPNCGANMRGE